MRRGDGALILGLAIFVGVFGYFAWKYKAQWNAFLASAYGLDYIDTRLANISGSYPLAKQFSGLGSLLQTVSNTTVLPPSA